MCEHIWLSVIGNGKITQTVSYMNVNKSGLIKQRWERFKNRKGTTD